MPSNCKFNDLNILIFKYLTRINGENVINVIYVQKYNGITPRTSNKLVVPCFGFENFAMKIKCK